MNKRSIKFLRKAAKSENGLKTMGRKKRRKDINEEMEEVEVESIIPMSNIKKSIKNEEEDMIQVKENQKKKHKDELADLRNTDPEFFEYLQKHDANLLDFGDDLDEDEENELNNLENENLEDENSGDDDMDGDKFDNFDDVDDDDDDNSDDDDNNNKGLKKSKKQKSIIETTEDVVRELITSSSNGSMSALKKILSIFRTTCLPNSDKQSNKDESFDQSNSRYVITNPEVYEFIMIEVLENLYKSFYVQLNLPLDRPLTKNDLSNISEQPKWKRIQLSILSFYKSILHILVTLSSQIYTKFDNDSNSDNKKKEELNKKSDNKNKRKKNSSSITSSSTSTSGTVSSEENSSCHVASFILSSLEPYIILLSPLEKLAKGVIKVLLSIWANGPVPEHDPHNVRGFSFLRLRQIVLILPEVLTEETFRLIYLTFARTAKSYNEYTASSVVFMSQSMSELYQLNISHAYQQGFLSIRQLSLHLRTAILKKSTESLKYILTWQYLNCIRLWTRILCSLPSNDDLGPLIYPLVQIIQGIIMVTPSITFLPYHFHLISCLQQLAAYSKLFIPTASYLLSYLDLDDFLHTSSTPSTDLPPKLQYIIKLSSTHITKPTVRDLLIENIFHLLRYDTEIYRFHCGLPEYLLITIKKLKLLLKKIKIIRWKDLLRPLIHQMEQYSSYVKTQRQKLQLNLLEVDKFESILSSNNSNDTCEKRLVKLMKGDQKSILLTNDTQINSDKKKGIVQQPEKGSIQIVTTKAKEIQVGKKSKLRKNNEDEDEEDENDEDSEENSDSNSDSEDDEEDDDDNYSNNQKNKKNQKKNSKNQSNNDKKNAKLSLKNKLVSNVMEMKDEVGALEWSDEEF